MLSTSLTRQLLSFPRGRKISSKGNIHALPSARSRRSIHVTRPLATSPLNSTPSQDRHTGETHSSPLSSINASEIAHFSRLSSQWWDEKGEFGLLHRMNGPRMEFVRQKVAKGRVDDAGWSFEKRGEVNATMEGGGGRWLEGLDVVDVGCGGGLLTESLARVGANVIGVDASPSNIAIASLHASQDPRLPFVPSPNPGDASVLPGVAPSSSSSFTSGASLRYRAVPAETLLAENQTFDLVCSMEVIEHVDAPGAFLKTLGSMVRPGGHLVLSTINRTPLSQLLTITMAEHVLRLVTPGTHTYSKFIKPSELFSFVTEHMGGREVWESDGTGLDVGEVRGIVYNPLKGEWRLWEEGRGWGEMCNYMFHLRKKKV